MILNTGGFGISLKEILDKYGCDFETIMVRCTWEDDGEQYDELIGYCKYINGELIPLDGDSYSLDDLYIRYENEGHFYTVYRDYQEWKDISENKFDWFNASDGSYFTDLDDETIIAWYEIPKIKR